MRLLSLSLRALAAALLLSTVNVNAAAAPAEADPELEALRDRVVKNLPEVRREDIQRSSATGLYEVRVDNAFGYVTGDGRFLISGEVVDMTTGERLTERRRSEARREQIKKLEGGAIEFAAAPEATQRWITVFTDVDCEYCRLLQREVPELNRLGISVRYLFFSKHGAPSEAFEKAQQVWCSSDRKAVLEQGLLSGELPPKKPRSLCKNPIADQYQAAARMGLRGTPMILFADGSLFAGYAKAGELVEEMDKREAAAERLRQQVGAAP